MKKIKEEEVKKIIQDAGFKLTDTRVLLISHLKKQKFPVNIKQVMHEIGNDIDQATVYRMLKSFRDVGVISELNFQESQPYYELKDDKYDHHHIICLECKKVEDFHGCNYQKLSENALKQVDSFQAVTSHIIELFGMCKKCFKNKSLNFNI